MLLTARFPFAAFEPDAAQAPATTGPEPAKPRGPVFIQDAVIPWQGETLLLSLLRAEALADQEQD
jgi:hypothetical protein